MRKREGGRGDKNIYPYIKEGNKKYEQIIDEKGCITVSCHTINVLSIRKNLYKLAEKI